MTTSNAGEAAKMGFYFNTRTWEVDFHDKDGGALPVRNGGRYVRIPAAVLLVVGPAMGFLFVIFLPFIGFALVARELGYKVAAWIGRMAHGARRMKTTPR